MESEIAEIQKKLQYTTTLERWHFVFLEKQDIITFFNTLQTPYTLNKK